MSNQPPSFDLATSSIQPSVNGGPQTVPGVAVNISPGNAPAVKHYVMAVGKDFTGSMPYLAFVMDQDVANPVSNSYFSNVIIRETNNGEQTAIDFDQFEFTPYAGQNEENASLTILDNGDTVKLSGNLWRKIQLTTPYIVTRYTVLEFDFWSESEGEIHAIGFTKTDDPDSKRIYQVYGTTIWGKQTYNDYAHPESGQSVWFDLTVDLMSNFTVQPNVSPDGTLTYTPAPEAAGYSTIGLRLNDSAGGTSERKYLKVVFTISGANRLPVISHHNFPDFAHAPNAVTKQDGDWHDPTTWVNDTLPETGDRVRIDHQVVYSTIDTARLSALGVNGDLTIAAPILVKDFIVYEDKHLRLLPGARITFIDEPIDIEADPEQYGTGLLVLGDMLASGYEKTTYLRTALNPATNRESTQAGATQVYFDFVPVEWHVGDRLAFPETRQMNYNDLGDQHETRTIAAISGNCVTLNAPLSYNHRGATNANGVLEFLPHVMNLTRDIAICSENPQGTRGHVLFAHHSYSDIRYVAFEGLGRTTIAALDNTLFAANGDITHVGTNQAARYAVHYHHAHGPHHSPSDYQYQLIGCAVDGGDAPTNIRWGITIHQTHYGLVTYNTVYNYAGSGIVTEDGNEFHNIIECNAVFRCAAPGTGKMTEHDSDDKGIGGYGFWFRGPHNRVRYNVSAGSFRTAFYQFSRSRSNSIPLVRLIPTYPGQMPSEYVMGPSCQTTPFLEFVGNEAYGSHEGVELYRGNGENPQAQASHIADTVVWHVTWGIRPQYDMNLTFYNWTEIGDASKLGDTKYPSVGFYGTMAYTHRVTMENVRIENKDVGIIHDGHKFGSYFSVDACHLANVINIQISPGGTNFIVGDRKQTLISNATYGVPYGRPVLFDIKMDASKLGDEDKLLAKAEAIVHYLGAMRRVYYNEQAANALLPHHASIPPVWRGVPNSQAWDEGGVAFAGEIAPEDAIPTPAVQGLLK